MISNFEKQEHIKSVKKTKFVKIDLFIAWKADCKSLNFFSKALEKNPTKNKTQSHSNRTPSCRQPVFHFPFLLARPLRKMKVCFRRRETSTFKLLRSKNISCFGTSQYKWKKNFKISSELERESFALFSKLIQSVFKIKIYLSQRETFVWKFAKVSVPFCHWAKTLCWTKQAREIAEICRKPLSPAKIYWGGPFDVSKILWIGKTKTKASITIIV